MFYNGNLSLIIKVLIPTNAVLIFIVFLPVGFLSRIVMFVNLGNWSLCFNNGIGNKTKSPLLFPSVSTGDFGIFILQVSAFTPHPPKKNKNGKKYRKIRLEY